MRVIPMGRTSERVLRCCALLGFGVGGVGGEVTHDEGPCQSTIKRISALLKSPQPKNRVFLTGPSGSGKTRLLRSVFHALQRDGCQCIMAQDPRTLLDRHGDQAAIELLSCTIEQALSILAAAGLCEASCIVHPIRILSEGQRWRLTLALAMQEVLTALATHPTKPCILYIDEFGGVLDETTARCVAWGLARWATRVNIPLLAAGPRPAAAKWLAARSINVLAMKETNSCGT